MRIIEQISEMQEWSAVQHREGRRIAFVPTMGFLHEGHLSLVRNAKQRGNRVVVSIFVNPKQFTPHEDFESYPRDFDRDRKMLEKEDIDVLFHPSAEEIYADGYQTHVEVEKLGAPLCGVFRSGISAVWPRLSRNSSI